MYWKCVLNISHHCSGFGLLTNICIGFGEYCGWTLGKTQKNISALFHMHVGLLKCMNHRLWNLTGSSLISHRPLECLSNRLCEQPSRTHESPRAESVFISLLALCVGSPPVTGGFPSQMSVTRSFGILFDLRLNKWLSKWSRCRWFETPWRPLWRHKWITQFIYRNHELVTNVKTFAQILMIGEFCGLCQSVIEFVNWTQIINNNWNTSRVGLCKDARVHSLIHKHMHEGYMWMIRYIISYK